MYLSLGRISASVGISAIHRSSDSIFCPFFASAACTVDTTLSTARSRNLWRRFWKRDSRQGIFQRTLPERGFVIRKGPNISIWGRDRVSYATPNSFGVLPRWRKGSDREVFGFLMIFGRHEWGGVAGSRLGLMQRGLSNGRAMKRWWGTAANPNQQSKQRRRAKATRHSRSRSPYITDTDLTISSASRCHEQPGRPQHHRLLTSTTEFTSACSQRNLPSPRRRRARLPHHELLLRHCRRPR